MSADIKGRPVLRPAGNVALRQEIKDVRGANLWKATKPPLSPPLKPTPTVAVKISPPNSQPSTPRTAITKSPVLKPNSSHKLPPSQSHKKPSTSPSNKPYPHPHIHAYSEATSNPKAANISSTSDPPEHTSDPNASTGPLSDPDSCKVGLITDPNASIELLSAPNSVNVGPILDTNACIDPTSLPNGCSIELPSYPIACTELPPCPHAYVETPGCPNESSDSAKCGLSSEPNAAKTGPKPPRCSSSTTLQRNPNPRISLTRSSSDVFQRGSSSNAKANTSSKNFNSIGSRSLDETSLANIVAAKKAAASELRVQRRLKVVEYGRKPGKASRVAPDVVSSPSSVITELQRCKFITAQSDPLYVAYHDEEWGVPIHDDRSLFELLVLAGAQVKFSWSTILHKRDAYRDAFCGYDPASVALFTEKHIQSLEADRNLLLPGETIRGVVENARRILEVVKEFGSLDNYIWGFLDNKPMINSYRYPKQVPAKTSKSESISKDLVKKGFRFVGPTIVYSFMQATGMTNDHLVQCFRHQACVMQSFSSSQEATQEKQQQLQGVGKDVECEASPLHMDADQSEPKLLLGEHDKDAHSTEGGRIII